MAKKVEKERIEVPELQRQAHDFWLIGTTPMVMNAVSEKVKQGLLLPPGKKTAADKKNTMKHDPVEEFHNSAHYMQNDDAPTLLGFPASGFKKAMSRAAIDIPGSTKASMDRLIRVHGYTVPIYGLPKYFMAVVRMADIGRTPDIRTRAILPEWCCKLTVSFVLPLLTLPTVTNLLSAAGEIIGIGDGRQEKGAFDFGSYLLASPDDKDVKRIVRTGSRSDQTLAMKKMEAFDGESKALLEWYHEERERLGR
jgi:hypothetical protein